MEEVSTSCAWNGANPPIPFIAPRLIPIQLMRESTLDGPNGPSASEVNQGWEGYAEPVGILHAQRDEWFTSSLLAKRHIPPG
jgi:hypothetical protein